MTSFDLNSINSALNEPGRASSGVDFSGKSLKLDTEQDAKPIIDAINKCSHLEYLTLAGNTLGVAAAQAIAKALETHPELKICRWSDMFTGRMKTEIPPALSALGDGMITAGARLTVLDLSDNAFGPIGVEGLAKLLQSDVCSQLQELRLNNNGLGITGGRLLANALSSRPRKLKVFIAGRNRLENDGATALAKVFQAMGSLEELAMPQNGIYHVGVSALSTALGSNPGLRALNLNDNTIGSKGAAAIAAALPRLKNLRSINFGDCLLKSKGARALAKGFRESGLALESLDLSHNEIGGAACAELVDALTARPDCTKRLNSVVLAGNSLGGASQRGILRDKLGDAARLDDSDDEYVTDSEEEAADESGDESGEQSGDESQDSATEDARHGDTSLDALDTSGVEEVISDVSRFLASPSPRSLAALGPHAADVIDTHLRSIKEPADLIQAYVEATMMVSGCCSTADDDQASQADQESARSTATEMYVALCRRASELHAASWLTANTMLRALALIKSENKSYSIRWPLAPCYAVLGEVIDRPHFPAALRDTLRFFIASKRDALPDDVKTAIKLHPTLTQ